MLWCEPLLWFWKCPHCGTNKGISYHIILYHIISLTQLQVLRTPNWGRAGKLEKRRRGEHRGGRSWTSQALKAIHAEDEQEDDFVVLTIRFVKKTFFSPGTLFVEGWIFFKLFWWINIPLHFETYHFCLCLLLPSPWRDNGFIVYCIAVTTTDFYN